MIYYCSYVTQSKQSKHSIFTPLKYFFTKISYWWKWIRKIHQTPSITFFSNMFFYCASQSRKRKKGFSEINNTISWINAAKQTERMQSKRRNCLWIGRATNVEQTIYHSWLCSQKGKRNFETHGFFAFSLDNVHRIYRTAWQFYTNYTNTFIVICFPVVVSFFRGCGFCLLATSEPASKRIESLRVSNSNCNNAQIYSMQIE